MSTATIKRYITDRLEELRREWLRIPNKASVEGIENLGKRLELEKVLEFINAK